MLNNRSRIVMGVVAAAMSFVVSCKKVSTDPAKPADANSSVEETQEPAFTRAEIRRESPLEIDTTGLAKAPEPTVDSVGAEEKPAAKPVSEPPPAPPSKPSPKAEAKPAAKPVEPAAAAPAGTPVPNETGEWVLQVNVHKSEAEAKAQIAKLGQSGIPAYAIQVPTGDANLSGNYWRVRVGRFDSRAAAQTYGKSVLEPKGLKFWIDRKSNETRQGT